MATVNLALLGKPSGHATQEGGSRAPYERRKNIVLLPYGRGFKVFKTGLLWYDNSQSRLQKKE